MRCDVGGNEEETQFLNSMRVASLGSFKAPSGRQVRNGTTVGRSGAYGGPRLKVSLHAYPDVDVK
jgi:hypothetical protein